MSKDSLQALRVLIVDDCSDFADSLAVVIRAWGYDAHVACNSSEALAAARTFRPHVILMDLIMPDTNGGELAHALRQDPELGKPTIIAMSGNQSELNKEIWASHVFEGWFVKPVDHNELERLLKLEAELLANGTLTSADRPSSRADAIHSHPRPQNLRNNH